MCGVLISGLVNHFSKLAFGEEISLSIRSFWGKRGRREAKNGREKISSPLAP